MLSFETTILPSSSQLLVFVGLVEDEIIVRGMMLRIFQAQIPLRITMEIQIQPRFLPWCRGSYTCINFRH
jgi:hypothetical protein